MQWVFGGGLGDHALTFFAGHVGEQLLGFFWMFAGFQDGGAGHGDQPADVATGEVVQLRIKLAFFPLQGEPVVVVHQNGSHFAVFHGFERDHVIAVSLAECPQTSQPLFGGVHAVHLDDRDRLLLEGAAGGHEADLALPFRIGKLHHRFRQVFFIDQLGVERHHADPGGHTDPGAIAGHVFLGQHRQCCVVSFGQQALLAEFVQRRGFFGVDHIGGGAIAFFHHLAGELIAAAFAYIDVNAGLGFEGFGNRVAHFFVLTVVEGQGNRVGGLGEGSGECQAEKGDGQAAAQGISKHHSQGSSLSHCKNLQQ
ncbi:hypothetical protein PS712_05680 [Pseudomonas fluorescens]|uniref:Uncharacterized protein n=1 Tax=Pseudomonas fluorescens TaxID=294 RepID=A0A5E7FIP5_PSEFL|nr:hypothetical protein PS712_05680 [Pseudomonas fluorescens]